MGLITKEVEVGISNNNIRYYEHLGYIIPKYIDSQTRVKVKRGTRIKIVVDDLQDGSNVKIDIECDECGKELKGVRWCDYKKQSKENDKYHCKGCASKLYGKGSQNKLSKQEIRNVINQKLGVGWKIERIEINRYLCVTLIDPEGYWYDKVIVNNLKKNQTPMKFHKLNKYTKQNINHWCKLNKVLIELISDYNDSHERLMWKCLTCNNTFEKSWSDILQKQVVCLFCTSNGISYPEKIGISLFDQLNFEYSYNLKTNWSENKRYDFIFEDLKIVCEFHGLQHYNVEFRGGRTLKEEKENDKIKKELAEHNGYKYIEIDCRKSDLEWIKNSVLNSELSTIFDLSNINWIKCHEFACSSFVRQACDLWKNGVRSTVRIGEIMKISKTTSKRYLKQGVILGWCNYNSAEALKEIAKKNGIKNGKPVIQLDLNKNYINKFDSASAAEKQIGVTHISSVCRGERKSAGGYKWIYYEDWLKQQGFEQIS